MILNNIRLLLSKFKFSNLSPRLLKEKHNCPIIKINIKDLHKYQTSLYSILNKMEENFESKLPKLGKINLTIILKRSQRQNNSRPQNKEKISR